MPSGLLRSVETLSRVAGASGRPGISGPPMRVSPSCSSSQPTAARSRIAVPPGPGRIAAAADDTAELLAALDNDDPLALPGTGPIAVAHRSPAGR